MNKYLLQAAALIILVGLAVFLLQKKPATVTVVVTDFNSCTQAQGSVTNEMSPRTCTYNGQAFTEKIQTQPDVIVDTPQPNTVVTSPLTVKGRAQNNWYFEANIPVTLKDTNGNILAQKGFQALTDWMIPGYVDFNDTLTFTTPQTQYGVLLIEKDNPSGLPENDKAFPVTVRFW